MFKKRKAVSVAMTIVMAVVMSVGVSAETNNNLKSQADDNKTGFANDAQSSLGYIPDYFEEHGIDTTQHIPTPFTKTVSELNTMITSTYPDGSYFSTTGRACSSHASCTPPSSSTATVCVNGCGTCIAYQSAIQCHGFAKYAYYVRNGKQITTGQLNTKYAITDSIISTKFTPGTMVRLITSSGSKHSILVTANNTSSKTLSIYHANYGGRCKVRYQTISYADFKAAFPKYYYYSNP